MTRQSDVANWFRTLTQQLSAVRRSEMKASIADLATDSGFVIKALDRVLTTS